MWSIIMEPAKLYSTEVKNTFHLTMAVLDVEKVKRGVEDFHTVYVETDDKPRVILCHLSKAKNIFQCHLDHVFEKGTNLRFITSGSASIHMTGYLDLNEDDDLYSDLESISENEQTPVSKKQEKGNKRKSEESIPKKSKIIKKDESNQALDIGSDSDEDLDDNDEIMDYEDDSDDDEEEEEEGVRISDLLDDESESESDEEEEEDDDEEDEDDDSDEVEDKPVSKQKLKKEQQTPKKQMNGIEQKTPKDSKKTPKGQEKTPKNQKTPMPKTPDANKSLTNGLNESNNNKKEQKTPLGVLKTKPDTPIPKEKQNQQQKLNGGVIINDIKIGNGAVAKPGKTIRVYYIGRLKSTGKVFDSYQQGLGFLFGLQRGEVIRGWDVGVAGMKVGGKRKIICPPNMAYGSKGSPPEIPPNSTLVFDVELKHVS